MSVTTKTEGFAIPGGDHSSSSRPHIHRPFSDGSMTVETDLLASLMNASPHTSNAAHTQNHHNPMLPSPFSFSQSLPARHHSFDYSMPSPLSNSVNGGDQFHPAAMFGALKFGNDNPEPPINLPPAPTVGGGTPGAPAQNPTSPQARSSSQSGKAPSSRSRSARKSMSDARPSRASIQRGRSTTANVPATATANGPTSPYARTPSTGPGSGKPMGLGIGLDTHVEGEPTDSISPPDFGVSTAFGLSIPRVAGNTGAHPGDPGSWGSNGMGMPGSMGSFETADDTIVESPMTPAKPLVALTDDSFKKQRRRECHNQVEKRRREHINAKIEELCTLLPERYNQQMNEEAAAEEDEEEVSKTTGKRKKGKRSGSTNKAQKEATHCKGRILTQSVNYIRDLQQVSDAQTSRIAQLEQLLLNFNLQPPSSSAPQHATHVPAQQQQQQSSLFPWMTAALDTAHNPFGSASASAHQHGVDAAHGLEVMRPSPDPERPFSFDLRPAWGAPPPAEDRSHGHGQNQNQGQHQNHNQGQGQGHHNGHANHNGDVFMTFEPSPASMSSGGSTDMHRMSGDTPSSDDGDVHNPFSIGVHSGSGAGANASIQSPLGDALRGRQRERTVRQDSQAELQMSMSSLFSGHRDDSGGIRW
ncbi:hypothetical protein IAT38_001949 [Cryptococcus sp. DSM 104549]